MTGTSSTRSLAWYTKPDCGLCERAWPHVRRAARLLRLTIHQVDVAGNAELMARYGLRLPVLAAGDEVLAEGAISRREAWSALLRHRLGR